MSIATVSAEWNASRLVSLAVDALRGIRWPQLRGAMLFGLVVTIVSTLIFMGPILTYARTMPLSMLMLGAAISDQVKALCLLAAIVIADRAVDDGAHRRSAYILAALVGCGVGVLLTQPLDWAWRVLVLPDAWPTQRPWQRGTAALYYRPIFALTHWLLFGGAAVFLYADRRAARKTEVHLHRAELDRIRRSKLAFESRLQAMQARVEPQFLFNTLAQVERLYELDPALASLMLDDLIAYLRAAMPRMRDTSSTVAQEIELARAYLAIVRIRLGSRLDVSIDIPAEHAEARLPPMMLLPLVDHAVVHGLHPSNAVATISIRSQVSDGRLRLIIVDSGAGFVPGDGGSGVTSIRERLEALYGDDATLDMRRAGEQSTEAVLEIPLQVREDLPESSRTASHA